MTATVAIVGAGGGIGRVVTRKLARQPQLRLRLAGRTGQELAQLADRCGGSVHELDVRNAEALRALCADSDVVVNCAGPSHLIRDTVASAALQCGASYVDPAGDRDLCLRVRRLADRGQQTVGSPARRSCAVLGAGMLPGLSGLLPRYLARGMSRRSELTCHVGGRDRFSRSSALDYLAGAQEGDSLACWRNGGAAARGLRRRADADIPGFAGRVTAHPFLDDEARAVARWLELDQGSWYNVIEGARVLELLSSFALTPDAEVDLQRAAGELVAAAALDCAGLRTHQTLTCELRGSEQGAEKTRSLVVRAESAAELTGSVAALSVQAVLAAQIPAGVHLAADVLDPLLVADLESQAEAVSVETYDGPLAQIDLEEGAL